jgi:hypothetical protein
MTNSDSVPLIIAVLTGRYTAKYTTLYGTECRAWGFEIDHKKNGIVVYVPRNTTKQYHCVGEIDEESLSVRTTYTPLMYLDDMLWEIDILWDDAMLAIQRIIATMTSRGTNHEIIYNFLRAQYSAQELYHFLTGNYDYVVYPLIVAFVNLEDMRNCDNYDGRLEYRTAYYRYYDIYEKNAEKKYYSESFLDTIAAAMHTVIPNNDVLSIIINKVYKKMDIDMNYTETFDRITQSRVEDGEFFTGRIIMSYDDDCQEYT